MRRAPRRCGGRQWGWLCMGDTGGAAVAVGLGLSGAAGRAHSWRRGAPLEPCVLASGASGARGVGEACGGSITLQCSPDFFAGGGGDMCLVEASWCAGE